MKKNTKMTVFGIISAIMSAIFNLMLAIWTYTLVAEQINTGWGFGTNLEILALVPMLLSLISVSALTVGAIYILFTWLLKSGSKPVFITATSLFGVLAVQVVLINLFIWY